jgi:hypothetical protein
MSSSEEYIRDFNLGYVRDIGYQSEFESVAHHIEEGAASDELKNNREARVHSAMNRLDSVVDELLGNAGLDCLNDRATTFITRMIAEAMIEQRDQSWEWFDDAMGHAETIMESPAKQD